LVGANLHYAVGVWVSMDRTERLLGALDAAVAEVSGDVAVLFSGGLDSVVVAALAKRHGRPRLYTVGIDGAPDLRAAEEAAATLDLPWVPMVKSEDDVLEACRRLLATVLLDDPVVLSYELPLQMVASQATEATLLTGQGADELFAGYHRYLAMGPEERGIAMDADLRRLLDAGVPIDRAIARRHGKAMHHPYLHPPVTEAARAFGPEEMIVQGVRKVPLREAAARLGLGDLARREKKAAQYGSGFMNVLKARARREGLDLRQLVAALARSGSQR